MEDTILWIGGITVVALAAAMPIWPFNGKSAQKDPESSVDPHLLEKGYYTEAPIDFFAIPNDKSEPISIMYTCPYCCQNSKEGVLIQINPEFKDAIAEAIRKGEGIPIQCWNCKKDITLTTSCYNLYMKPK